MGKDQGHEVTVNRRILIILAAFSVLFLSSQAMAHKVNVFAYVENGIVYVEGYFPDGRPVINGDIEVLDSKGQKLLKGTTDKEGKFSFPVPARNDLTIVINASMGHRAQFILKKNELE